MKHAAGAQKAVVLVEGEWLPWLPAEAAKHAKKFARAITAEEVADVSRDDPSIGPNAIVVVQVLRPGVRLRRFYPGGVAWLSSREHG
jgi:hypothetical protein